MKEEFKSFILAGAIFGIIMGLFIGISTGLITGIILGISSGIIFGLILSIFIYVQKRKFRKMDSEITMGKDIILDGAANHFVGLEGVGGWLYLTSEDLIFRSHAFNVQTHQTVIHLKELIDIKAVATAGVIPNGLHLKLKDGIVEKFVVNNRKRWIQSITSNMNN